MRHGWEIKKLGEVCTFRRGLTYTKGDEVEFSENCVLRSNNIDLDTMSIVLDDLKCVRKDLAIGEDKIVKPNTILVCMSNGSKQHIGKVAFIDREYGYAFGGFMGLIIPQSIFPKYVYYSCLSPSYKHFLRGIGNGANITNLKFSNLSNYTIPIPPLSEQERIVEELDLLSDVIAKKREQLKQLDTLAQSIFYDMFGDPITNEKGWKQVSLVDICKNTGVYGAGSSSMPKQLYRPRYVRITDILDSGDLNDDFVVSSNVEDDETYRLNVGDILFARSGATVGKTYLYRGNEAQIYAGYLIKFSLNILYVNPIFIFYITKNRSYKLWISKQIIGVAQPNINAQKYGKLPIILPPLALQQQFASMIESIEKQKELIKQSLSEVQQLFDSRMDYYFG